MSDEAESAETEIERLTEPRDGIPPVVEDEAGLDRAVQALAAGTGPVAVDAERASGYRYGQRAYLVQLRRRGAGTWLVDPVPVSDLSPLNEALQEVEWVLHAATQDLPCLAEVGLRPRTLFDTELGARLAGLPKVGLTSVLEHYLQVSLAKEHSAVDWSTRPLPESWLRYAALDVELLVEVRDAMAADLAEQGKTEWAAQEFVALSGFTAHASRPDPWRRTSGMHKVRSRRVAATLRELWEARDRIAQDRDVAPGRVLPDATLIDLAMRAPRTPAALARDGGAEATRSRQRRAHQGLLRHQRRWLQAIRDAGELADTDLPEVTLRSALPPPARAWADRDPVAAARLAQVRDGLAVLSEQHGIPVENLLAPETLRRVLWQPPPAHGDGGEVTEADVDAALIALGARRWQRELTTPLITAAISDTPNP
ncbi:ribonuclease D [soil metagenome]